MFAPFDSSMFDRDPLSNFEFQRALSQRPPLNCLEAKVLFEIDREVQAHMPAGGENVPCLVAEVWNEKKELVGVFDRIVTGLRC